MIEQVKLIQVKTGDGSGTLYNPVAGEHYHSTNGALTESVHVFIQAGMLYQLHRENRLRILEVGLGTGLNALLTLSECRNRDLTVDYTAIEPFPLGKELIAELNYCSLPGLSELSREFAAIHNAASGKTETISKDFSFTAIRKTLDNFLRDTDNRYNLIYFDAFSPQVAPDLWTPEVFQALRRHMPTGATLVTYSAKGLVRRAMQAAGMQVERLPGPPGKREMLRATAILK